MFRLNRLTDYAVVLLARMARDLHSVHTAPQIARDTGVPLPTVARVMNLLAHHGLVFSQRGAAGGYCLTRAPEEITVAEIVEAVEGPIALTACVDGASGNCDSEQLCPMRGNWDRVNLAIRGALRSVSLREMSAVAPPFADFATRAGGKNSDSVGLGSK